MIREEGHWGAINAGDVCVRAVPAMPSREYAIQTLRAILDDRPDPDDDDDRIRKIREDHAAETTRLHRHVLQLRVKLADHRIKGARSDQKVEIGALKAALVEAGTRFRMVDQQLTQAQDDLGELSAARKRIAALETRLEESRELMAVVGRLQVWERIGRAVMKAALAEPPDWAGVAKTLMSVVMAVLPTAKEDES